MAVSLAKAPAKRNDNTASYFVTLNGSTYGIVSFDTMCEMVENGSEATFRKVV